MIGLKLLLQASQSVTFEDFAKVQKEDEETIDRWEQNKFKDLFYDLSSAMQVESDRYRELQEKKKREQPMQEEAKSTSQLSKAQRNRHARKQRHSKYGILSFSPSFRTSTSSAERPLVSTCFHLQLCLFIPRSRPRPHGEAPRSRVKEKKNILRRIGFLGLHGSDYHGVS
jgi:hypothetical protein